MTKWTPPWADGSDMGFVPVGLADQGVTYAQYEQGEYDEQDTSARELTDDEVNAVLNGDYTALGLTADGTENEDAEQTGAMIALLPSEDDMNRIVVEGGEEDEELHLTLCYLGDAAKIGPQTRDDIISYVRNAVQNMPIIDADGFGVAAFNQDNEKEPCVVLLVSGSELTPVRRTMNSIAQDMLPDSYPVQYEPWVPHVTLAYTSDSSMVKKLKDREGPIRFDHVRVAFGGEVTDFPLYDGTVDAVTAASEHWREQPRNKKGEWTESPAEKAVDVVTDTAKKVVDEVKKSEDDSSAIEKRVSSAKSGNDVTKYLPPKSDYTYDAQDALQEYQGSGFFQLNGQLRSNDGNLDGVDPEVRSKINAIDNEMAQSQLYGDNVLYRSVNGPNVFGTTSPAAGHTWVERGYSSTAAKKSGATAGVFGGGLGSKDVLMRVIATSGTGALNLGGSEHEVLLQRNLRYKVLRSYEQDGQKMVDVEVSPGDGMTAAATFASKKESDVNAKGGNHNLKDYWTHGAGAAKIGWGTDGSFARCVAQLGKYVKNPQGLCAEYHKAATGEWPTQGGKHGIPSAGDIVVFENEDAVVAATDANVDLASELGDYDGGWEGTLMVEDSDTGDGRMFSGGSVTWGDTTETIHPLQWAASNLGEHKGSVTVGRIDKIWRNPENPRQVMGKGRFNVNDPDGLRAFRQMRDGFAGGVSVDPDQVTDADVELEFALGEDGSDPFAKPTKTIFHAGRLRGATLVAFPALVEASIKLTKKGESSAIVASVTDAPWRAVEHELRLGDGELDGLVAAAAFAYVKDIDDIVTRQQCRFLHHEIGDDGTPGAASLVACAKYIDAINAGRAFGLTHRELFSAYRHMAQHFYDAGQNAPAFTLETESMVAAAVPATAPLEWFGKPELSGPTPVTVTPDGRVFGHAACWGTCHTGFADTCVTPPAEQDYSYFTTGEVLTAEGHRVAVGQITLGTSHAPTRGVSLARAIDHYGDTGTAVADVTAGTDEFGIWIAGAVRPGTSDEHVHALRASALSGDWRRIAGSLRMVALLAVNVPGFPIPRVGTALAQGKQISLVAAGVVDRTTMSVEDELATLDMACGIASAMKKPKLKYASLEAELADLDKF